MSPNALVRGAQPTSEAGPEWNSRILIIDDEVAIAQSLKNILVPEETGVVSLRKTSRGLSAGKSHNSPESADGKDASSSSTYEVVVVHNPAAALSEIRKAIAQQRPFAMGFFDVMLNAEIDGIQLVKEVFSLDPKMQAVFVTAYSDRSVDSIHQFLGTENAARWDYVNKPFTQGEISQKARNVVSLWNLREQKMFLDEKIAESQKWLLEAERSHTIAAVSRGFVHEFGNIMTQIMGHCELALMKKDPERMRTALEVIQKASETASSILGKFKNVSTPALPSENEINETQSPTPQLINLANVLDDALELMKFQFKKSKIEYKKLHFENLLIEGYKNSLFQVFMNILINAVHAMPEGGVIEVTLKKDSEQAFIKIRDFGKGIESDYLDRIFEANFTTKGDAGSGLGLSICKEIIEIEHQGQIIIRNHPQKGVEAEIHIPQRLERF